MWRRKIDIFHLRSSLPSEPKDSVPIELTSIRFLAPHYIGVVGKCKMRMDENASPRKTFFNISH